MAKSPNRSCNPDHQRILSSAQLGALSAEQLAQLGGAQLASMSPAQIAALSTEQLVALTTLAATAGAINIRLGGAALQGANEPDGDDTAGG